MIPRWVTAFAEMPPATRVVIAAACTIALIGLGVRASFGLFLEPMTASRGWSRETFALAMAWQNLAWGIGTPFAGALADRFGARVVMVAGALLYAAGVIGMGAAESALMLSLSGGLLAGTGVALTSFSIALAAIARVTNPAQRPMALGLGTAAGSLGQVLFSPFSHAVIAGYGWPMALVVIAASALAIAPLALLLPRADARAMSPSAHAEQSLGASLLEAAGHRGYVLLTLGFFVCGFHVAFISVHFPAYIRDLGLSSAAGAWALALLGLFNIAGSIIAGIAGQRFSKRTSLCWIYALRALVITALLLAPVGELTIYLFSAAMGLLWLSTVPLTTGIVAQVFGVRFMATLFGIVFLSHQIGGFLGIWLGGRIFDATGSYEPMWWAGVALSVVATLVHWPIDERPLPRLAETTA